MRWLTRVLLLGGVVGAAGGACYQDDSIAPINSGRPMVTVLLTDAPFPYDLVERVDVYVVEIAASAQADTGPGQSWVTIAEPRRRFNLLELQQGTTALVGVGELPADVYRAVRLTLDADSSSVTFRAGGEASVNWPGGGAVFSLHALVEAPIDVPQAGAQIVIDFDVGRSFVYGISFCCDFVFIPWIRAVNAAATGDVAGTVLADQDNDGDAEPLATARITVYRGDPAARETWVDWASGHTDAQGRYRLAYLRPDDYIVEIDAPGRANIGAHTAVVRVTQGASAPLSVTLPNGAGIRIRGNTFSVVVGGAIALEAVVTDAVGDAVANPAVSWASRNPAVATVASPPETPTAATVSAGAPGQVYIVATSGVLADSVLIRAVSDTTGGVNPSDPVATVTVEPEAATLAVGDSSFFRAVLRNAGGATLTGRTVTWTVSDAAVLHLFNTEGETVGVRPLKAGAVSLQATSEGKTGTAVVQVQ